MNSVLKLSAKERAQLFEATAQKLGIDAVMIEKDFWVCWTLRQLFSLPGIGDHLIFKGGTSLSKVWRAIERFSEDIDVSLSRAWLGFKGENDPERATTGKKREKKLLELSATCAAKIKAELLPFIVEQARKELGDKGWSFNIDEKDTQTILFAYPTAMEESVLTYIPRQVRIEAGARSDDWPSDEKSIQPYVAEAFSDRITDCKVAIKTLSIERTFWEKATILHAEVHRPKDKEIPLRYSRHYSDLAMLAASKDGLAAIKNDKLRARVVEHKQVFFFSAWANYQTAVRGTFRLLPADDRLASLERDYREMQQMFFGKPMPWAEVVKTLARLEAFINSKEI